MVSLWGSKNDEEEEDQNGTSNDGEGSRPNSGRRGRDADERTRLLPPRNDGYLDPDDPAVSWIQTREMYERVIAKSCHFPSRCLLIIYGASGPYDISPSSFS